MQLVDGRELHVHHRDYAQLGRAVQFVIYLHPNGQVEFVDADQIVSLRTIYPADFSDYSNLNDESDEDQRE
jgi:hypothetical protein